jgi:hypothetical protein
MVACRGLRFLVCVLLVLVLAGCQTTLAPVAVTAEQLQSVKSGLMRPLPGNLAALYRLRASSTGSLRLSVLTNGEAGRLSINGSFGAAHSITAWAGSAPPELFDMRNQCRLVGATVSSVLGVARLPMPQAIRLLAGRLPATTSDQVSLYHDGRLLIQGHGWACLASVRSDPWRVVAVEELTYSNQPGWHITLDDHSLSLPGRLRLIHPDGDWVELDLANLEWRQEGELPALPDLPLCSETS